MSRELSACFFCGMPIMSGESASGVICDSPNCRNDLVGFLRALSERYGGHKENPLEMANHIFKTIDRTANLIKELMCARNDVVRLIQSFEKELSWLDNFANPDKLRTLKDCISGIRVTLDGMIIADS